MNRQLSEETPSEIWQSSLNATCNRLSTQYLSLVRSAMSLSTTDGRGGSSQGNQDSRAGGGAMVDPNEPPPPLASDVTRSALQAKLAAQNICVASSNLLDLIRTLRLSALLMDEETIAAEEEDDCQESGDVIERAIRESLVMEQELMKLRNEVESKITKDGNNS